LRRIRDSAYWEPLLARYARSPSIALCRVPELELFSALELSGAVLDHCCGDGYIVAQAFPGRTLAAGVDLNEAALAAARQRGNYLRLERADAGSALPFASASFGTVLNNSGIEHIADLERAVAEVARVLEPGGRFHFNVLNSRYFDWWPNGAAAAADYRQFQPFHHALDERAWAEVLSGAGFSAVSFRDYFPRATAQRLAEYDYKFSAFYLRRRVRPDVLAATIVPVGLLRSRWRHTFGALQWEASAGEGAGFLVSATRSAR
jgi:SAM-dependent methyltransferase